MPEYIKIQGNIHGDPELYSYVNSCEIIFALELTKDLPELDKKIGEIIVVHYSSNYITYIRRGDRAELLGHIESRHLKNKDITVQWIEANKLYNETLHFSFDY
ncbi:MAG: hypothetical protein ACTSQI_00550 [Candidatus Helarchaeota archaeon]